MAKTNCIQNTETYYNPNFIPKKNILLNLNFTCLKKTDFKNGLRKMTVKNFG